MNDSVNPQLLTSPSDQAAKELICRLENCLAIQQVCFAAEIWLFC